MVTFVALIISLPIGLWLVGELLSAVLEARARAARARDREIAEALLREWTRLQEAVDLDPAEVVSAAERILRETRG